MIDHALLLQVDTRSFQKFSGSKVRDNMSSVDELPWAWAFSDYRPKKKADVPCRIAPIKPCQPPMQSTEADVPCRIAQIKPCQPPMQSTEADVPCRIAPIKPCQPPMQSTEADVPCRIAPIKPCQPPMQSTDAIRSATKSEQSPEEQVRALELSETRIIYVEEAEECNRIHYSDYEYLN